MADPGAHAASSCAETSNSCDEPWCDPSVHNELEQLRAQRDELQSQVNQANNSLEHLSAQQPKQEQKLQALVFDNAQLRKQLDSQLPPEAATAKAIGLSLKAVKMLKTDNSHLQSAVKDHMATAGFLKI